MDESRRIMPPARGPVTLLAALLAACTPGEFVWRDPETDELADYRAAFAAAAGSQFVAECDLDELLAWAAASRVLWLGDHHFSERLHASLDRLLQRLAERGVPVVLCLEAIGTQDQPAVDAFLGGERPLATLRRDIAARWPGSWLEDGELDGRFYRGLLTRARSAGWPVRAIEPVPRPPLLARDAGIAETVRAVAAAHPRRLVVVVVGQAHLLGLGDLIARTGLPAVGVGGEPPAGLAAAAPAGANRLLQSDAGLWWFSELLDRTRARGAAPRGRPVSSLPPVRRDGPPDRPARAGRARRRGRPRPGSGS